MTERVVHSLIRNPLSRVMRRTIPRCEPFRPGRQAELTVTDSTANLPSRKERVPEFQAKPLRACRVADASDHAELTAQQMSL